VPDVMAVRERRLMNYSKETVRFVRLLVHSHAKFDVLADQHILSYDDLADFDLEKLSALIMLDNPDCAHEAIGPDNPRYDISMLPALTLYMRDTLNKDAAKNFHDRWRTGIVFYFRHEIEGLIEDALSEHNHERAA
jgi:hypothetical protein